MRKASEQCSYCDAIVTPTPGEITFPILKRLAGAGLAVTDQQVLHAMKIAFGTLKLVTGPGGAVALAAALFGAHLPDADELLVIASGGNVDGSTFQKALAIG